MNLEKSSKKLHNKLILNVKKSNFLIGTVLFAHAGAMLVAFLVPLAWGWRLGLAALIAASFLRQKQRGAWQPVGHVQFDDDGYCRMERGDGLGAQRHRIVHAAAHPGFIRLVLDDGGRRPRILLLMQDAIEPETYRQLRARIAQRRLVKPDQAAA